MSDWLEHIVWSNERQLAAQLAAQYLSRDLKPETKWQRRGEREYVQAQIVS